MIFKPVVTDDVCRLTAPGLGVCVDGEDVDINRFWGLALELPVTDSVVCLADISWAVELLCLDGVSLNRVDALGCS